MMIEKGCQRIIEVDYDIIPITQRCAGKCKEHYPATFDFFYSNKTRSNELDSVCKKCCKIKSRETVRKKNNIPKERWRV